MGRTKWQCVRSRSVTTKILAVREIGENPGWRHNYRGEQKVSLILIFSVIALFYLFLVIFGVQGCLTVKER